MFHPLPGSAWADGNLAELAEQLGKMVEHPKTKSIQPRFARRWVTLYITWTYLKRLFYKEGSWIASIKCLHCHNAIRVPWTPIIRPRVEWERGWSWGRSPSRRGSGSSTWGPGTLRRPSSPCRLANICKVATYRLEYRAKTKEQTQFGSVSGSEIQNLPFSLGGIISLYRAEPKEPT